MIDRPGSALTVYERFADVVRRSAESLAIVEKGRRVSYAQLDQMALAVMQRLNALGHPRAGIVAILAEERIAAITAMLGTAGSGHAYVSLDPGDPEERLRFIIQDSAPFVFLVDRPRLERAHALKVAGLAVLDLDEIMSESTGDLPARMASPDDLLYLFYTSGSTGHPKGVQQTHRNLMFFVDAYARTLRINETDRLSLLYTLSFSAANMDIFGALFNGAVLCPYDMRREGISRLAAWLEESDITVLHAVPTVLRELTRTREAERRFPRIRAVDLGGETLLAGDVARFRPLVLGTCRIVNHLAATEASVIAQCVIDPAMDAMSGALPVGRSPTGLEVRILRADGSDADTDESGFIAVDSPHLSPGYWHRPELDRATFSDLQGRPGWRRYRSGDLGRIDGTANLHFIGRESTRIKLRGQSVDLSEVEAALSACHGVKDAVVIARGAEGREADRLVACVVMSPGAGSNPVELRRQLVEKLPNYMLPSGYLFRDRLPTSATGKLDRRSLSEMDLDDALYRPDYEAPVGEREVQVAALFSQVLNFTPVGRFDDFFLLGGDSLSLVDLQLQSRSVFGCELPSLREDGTVAGLAARLHVSEVDGAGAMPRLVPLREQGTAPMLYLVHGRLGQAHVSPRFMSLLGEDQPLCSIQARGLDGLEDPNESISAMAADYVDALRCYQPEGPYFIGSLCAGAYVAIEMARLLQAAGAKVLPLLLLDPPAPPFRTRVKGMNEDSLLRRLKRHENAGNIKFRFDGSRYATAAIRVARAFEGALRMYSAVPHDGPVFILASHSRLSSAHWGNPATRRRVFSGSQVWLSVADSHGEMLDPRNAEFALRLTQCMLWIRTGEPPENMIRGSLFDDRQTIAGGSRWRRGFRWLFGFRVGEGGR